VLLIRISVALSSLMGEGSNCGILRSARLEQMKRTVLLAKTDVKSLVELSATSGGVLEQ
jgi:hypothetical protein